MGATSSGPARRARPGTYEHLGLFWNPFGEVPAADWPALISTTLALDPLAEALRAGGVALVLSGRMGRGKSTHLRALHAAHFAALPYTYLGAEASPRTSIPAAPVCFVDEVQRLGPRVRRRLFRRARSLALTTHSALAPELRPRFRVIEHHIAGLDRGRLAAIVARRVRWAARPGAEARVPEISAARLDALLATHGDDLRAIQAALYDDFEALRREQP